MIKKTQRIKGKNPLFLDFSYPDCFLPYADMFPFSCQLFKGIKSKVKNVDSGIIFVLTHRGEGAHHYVFFI